ncbi:MAG: glycoside hydrolase family 3 N-terminal domain-containing protein, partial [Chloroflexota bacterium]
MTATNTSLTLKTEPRDIETRVEQLLAQMTLAEKIGQMTQVEKNSIQAGDIAALGIGSILSGGGGNPKPNNPASWREMVNGFISESLESRLGIPLIYGSDCVHGHNNCKGATIFPHNISLGAAGDEDLVERIAAATALEMQATGVRWNFAPAVSL